MPIVHQQEFPLGLRVIIKNLSSQSATKYNGKPGKICGYVELKARYKVRLESSSKTLQVKAANIEERSAFLKFEKRSLLTTALVIKLASLSALKASAFAG